MPTQRKGLLLPFPSDNSRNCCHTFPPPVNHDWKTNSKKMLNFPLSPLLFCVFLTFLILHAFRICESLNCGELDWREKRCSHHFTEACVFNRVPVLWVLVFPPAWGVWNGAYLRIWHWFFSSWINFKMFCWLFMGFSHLPCSLESPMMPICCFSSQVFSVPGPTSLHPLLYISGDYRDFGVDCCVNHLPSGHRCIS